MQHVRSSHGPFFLCGAQRDARYSRRLTSRTELTVGCLSRSKTSLNLFVYVSFFFSPKKVGFLWCVSKWGPFISVGPMKTLTVQQVFLCRRQHTCVFFFIFLKKNSNGPPFFHGNRERRWRTCRRFFVRLEKIRKQLLVSTGTFQSTDAAYLKLST